MSRCGWVVLALLLLFPVLARADEDPLDAARKTFAEAVDAQEAGRYNDALALYARVRETAVSPTLLFNVAACHDALGSLLESRRQLELALDEARRKDDAEVERAATARLEAIDAEIPRVVVTLAAGTESPEATLDGAAIQASDLADLRLDPGPHRLVIRSERHVRVFELSFDLPRRALRSVPVDLGPKHDQARALPPPPKERSYVAATLVGSAAVVLTAGAVITGVLGHDRRQRFDDLNAQPTAANRQTRENLRDEGTSLYAVNAVLTTAAVLAAGTCLYLALFSNSSSSAHRTAP